MVDCSAMGDRKFCPYNLRWIRILETYLICSVISCKLSRVPFGDIFRKKIAENIEIEREEKIEFSLLSSLIFFKKLEEIKEEKFFIGDKKVKKYFFSICMGISSTLLAFMILWMILYAMHLVK